MSEPDEIMIRIGQAIELGQQGERARARVAFAQVWEQIVPADDPFHRCALAHSMADVQDDPYDELVWDLRALEAANLVTDERLLQAGVGSPAVSLFPSLHLNLGETYRKLGDLPAARHHLVLGLERVGTLPEDGYGTMIKRGLDALAGRLSTE